MLLQLVSPAQNIRVDDNLLVLEILAQINQVLSRRLEV